MDDDEPPIRNTTGRGMVCARCDVWTKVRFPKSLDEIAHMTHGGEYTTLEEFPVEIYCPQCGDSATSTGRNMTVDLDKGIIVYCDIDKVPGDMSPPDTLEGLV